MARSNYSKLFRLLRLGLQSVDECIVLLSGLSPGFALGIAA